MSESVAVQGTLSNYTIDTLYRLDRYVGGGQRSEVFHAHVLLQDLHQVYDRTFIPSLVDEMVQDDQIAQKQRDGYLRQHIRRYGKKLLPEELSLVLRTKFALDPRLTGWQEAGTLVREAESVPQKDGRVEALERVPVAIKFLRMANNERKSDLIKEVLRDWRWQAKIVHPNLIGVLDAGTGRVGLQAVKTPPWAVRDEDFCPYLVLEYLPGVLEPAAVARLSGLEQVAAIRQAAAGLRALHAQGLLHRDIQPGNLLVTRAGGRLVTKLSEFGVLLKNLTPQPGSGMGVDAATTARERANVAYRSPEEAIGAATLTPAADVYSLAATLFYYAVGKMPYAECGGGAQVILAKKLAGELPAIPGEHPDFLVAMLKRGLAPDPAFRYGSLKEFVADLEVYARILQREPMALKDTAGTLEFERTLLGSPRPLPEAVRPNAWKSPGAPRDLEPGPATVTIRRPSEVLEADYSGPIQPGVAPLPARMVSGRMEVMRITAGSDLPSVGGGGSVGSLGNAGGGMRRESGGMRRPTGAGRRVSHGQGAARIGSGGLVTQSAGSSRPPSDRQMLEAPPKALSAGQWFGIVAVIAGAMLTGAYLFMRTMAPPVAVTAGGAADRLVQMPPPGSTTVVADAAHAHASSEDDGGGGAATADGSKMPGAVPAGFGNPAPTDPRGGSGTAGNSGGKPKVVGTDSSGGVTGNRTPNVPGTLVGPDNLALTAGKVGVSGVDFSKYQLVPVSAKHTKRVVAAVFSNDARRLVTISEDQRAILWTSAEGNFIGELRGTSGVLSAAAFAPNASGDLLIASTGGKAWLFSTEGETPTSRELLAPGCAVSCVAFSPDGLQAFVGDAKGVGHLFDTGNWVERTGKIVTSGAIGRACFTLDGKAIVLAGKDAANATLELWQVADGTRLKVLGGHKSWVADLALSPDGATLVAVDWLDSALVEFNTADWQIRTRLADPGAQPLTAVFSPDGRSIISGGRDTQIKVWDAASGKLQKTFDGPGQNNYCRSVAITPDGRCIVAGYEDGGFRLYRDPQAPLPGAGLFVEHRDAPAEGAGNLCENKRVQLKVLDADGKMLAVDPDALAHLVDGNLAGEGLTVEGKAVVVIDLGAACMVSAVKVYHEPMTHHKFLDQVWQLSPSASFDGRVLTVFNNDSFDTHGWGRGHDADYVADVTGKQVSFAPVAARYLRIACGGNEVDAKTSLLEIQVYGTVVGGK